MPRRTEESVAEEQELPFLFPWNDSNVGNGGGGDRSFSNRVRGVLPNAREREQSKSQQAGRQAEGEETLVFLPT